MDLHKITKKQKQTAIFLLLIFLFSASFVGAQTYIFRPGSSSWLQGYLNPLGFNTVGEFLQTAANVIFWLVLALGVIPILLGAFYIITAGSDAKRVQTGRNYILYAAIGMGVTLFARGIFYLVSNLGRR